MHTGDALDLGAGHQDGQFELAGFQKIPTNRKSEEYFRVLGQDCVEQLFLKLGSSNEVIHFKGAQLCKLRVITEYCGVKMLL